MATTATMNKNKREVVPEQYLSKIFADVFQSFMECSDEIQQAIREMVKVVKSPDATEEEKESALETIAEALFPSRYQGEIGIDFGEEYAKEAPPNIKRVLNQMELEQAEFGERVNALLEARSMTQADLAATIGVGQSAVSMIINRECRPQKRTVEKIADALKVSPEELWPGIKDD